MILSICLDFVSCSSTNLIVCVTFLDSTGTNMCEDLTLSKKEALTFFNDKLAIHDVHAKISKNKIDFLNEVATNWLVHIPFQNLTQLSKSKDNKAIGNLKTVVGDILTGVGGLCFHHNLALYLLLKALECDVYLAASAVLDKNKVDHVVVIVRNLQSGRDLYLMDVGCGVPCFTAVPLDFEESSVVFKEAYLTYKVWSHYCYISNINWSYD